MKNCISYPWTILKPAAEHLLVLLLIELTLYVRPCAMEMPTLLAALLHDTGVQHHGTFEDFNDVLIPPPPPAPQQQHQLLQSNDAIADAVSSSAINSVNSMNELIDSNNDLLNDVTIKHKHEDFEIAIPPPMATSGIPSPEIVHRHAAPSSSSSSSHDIVVSRYCSIEITSKVPGICQTIPHPIGSACVAGDYMDVFNVECMNGI